MALGSIEMALLHAGAGAIGGAIMGDLRGALGGALGAGLSELVVPNLDVASDTRRSISQILGGFGSLVVGDVSMAGATSALNGVLFNFDLHGRSAAEIMEAARRAAQAAERTAEACTAIPACQQSVRIAVSGGGSAALAAAAFFAAMFYPTTTNGSEPNVPRYAGTTADGVDYYIDQYGNYLNRSGNVLNPADLRISPQAAATEQAAQEDAAAVRRGDASAGSDEHKQKRWREYQERDGTWSYDRWSTVYELNMQRANLANQTVAAYRDELGWGQTEYTVQVPMPDGSVATRRLDIADPEGQRGVEYKTGYQYATPANLSEIARDAAFDLRP